MINAVMNVLLNHMTAETDKWMCSQELPEGRMTAEADFYNAVKKPSKNT